MINFTAWPEMLAWPYLMLNGWLPYRDIAIAHNPLLLFDLVIFFKLFGVGIMQLKIYTWILIAFNTWLTFFVTKKFWSQKIGLLTSVLYILFCIIYQGNGLWFDLALTPFALLLYLFVREKKYAYAGLIFALGFLTKQTFVYFALPVAIAIVQSTEYKVLRIKQFLLGGFPVAVIFALILSIFGILDDYYNWAIKFGIFYLPNADGQILLPNLKQFIFAISPFGVLIFNSELLIITFALVGALGVYPRWELFHFQPALPFLSIVLASFVYSKRNIFLNSLIIVCSMLYVVYGVGRQLGVNTRFFEPEVQKVTSEITKHKPLVSNIYVINYWDNVYALTNTFPNSPLIPYIPWYLDYQGSKQSILDGLKAKSPELIVIGERDKIFPELYIFVDNYYSCNVVEKKVELCEKN